MHAFGGRQQFCFHKSYLRHTPLFQPRWVNEGQQPSGYQKEVTKEISRSKTPGSFTWFKYSAASKFVTVTFCLAFTGA